MQVTAGLLALLFKQQVGALVHKALNQLSDSAKRSLAPLVALAVHKPEMAAEGTPLAGNKTTAEGPWGDVRAIVADLLSDESTDDSSVVS